MKIETSKGQVTLDFHHGFDFTNCIVKLDNNSNLFNGSSRVSSNDKFVKVIGRRISLKRALSPLDKKLRTEIWNEYLKKINVLNNKRN